MVSASIIPTPPFASSCCVNSFRCHDAMVRLPLPDTLNIPMTRAKKNEEIKLSEKKTEEPQF